MESSLVNQKTMIKAFRNLRLSGVKTNKHIFKIKKHSRSIPFDIFRCPKLVSSVIFIQAFTNQYQLVLYKENP